MRPSRLRVLWLLPFLSPTVRGAGQAEPHRTFLHDVNVVDLRQGEILRGRSLLIEGERIVAIDSANVLHAPAGAQVVEGGGRYLVPGLFDMHVHLAPDHAEDSLFLWLANGVTSVQCMGGSPWHLELRTRLARGELDGPRLFTCGPTTAALRVHTPEEAERVVRAQKAAGYDAVKMYGDGSDTMPAETYRRLVATGHEIGMRIVGHAPRNLPFDLVLEARQDSIDHMEEIVYTETSLAPVVGPWIAVQFGRTRLEDHPELTGPVPDFRPPLAEAVAALARRVRAAGLALTPTLVTFATIQATTDAGFERLLAKDELRYVSPDMREGWERARFRNGGWKPHLATIADYLRRNAELQSEMLRVFHAAGVPVMTGTDAPFDFVVPGFGLHDELARFVAAGLTPLEALRSATRVPAVVLGLDDGSGEIAVGGRADLVLLESDPLADIAATRRNAGVFLRGRFLSAELLAQGLSAIEERNARFGQRIRTVAAALERRAWAEALELRRAQAPDPRLDARLDAWLEARLNSEGYALLGQRRLDEAVEVLRLNAQAFPASANTWDSLGEACLARGALEEALGHYEHVLELEPGNAGAMHAIDTILERMEADPSPGRSSK